MGESNVSSSTGQSIGLAQSVSSTYNSSAYGDVDGVFGLGLPGSNTQTTSPWLMYTRQKCKHSSSVVPIEALTKKLPYLPYLFYGAVAARWISVISMGQNIAKILHTLP